MNAPFRAGRPLSRGERRWKEGDPVTEQDIEAHFSDTAIASLRSSGGLIRNRAGRADHPLYEMNVQEAIGRIVGLGTLEELDAWLAAEEAHPRFAGGRGGVLAAIEARRDELNSDTE